MMPDVGIVAASNMRIVKLYSMLRFSQQLYKEYEFDRLSTREELEAKLDKGIVDLEHWIEKKVATINDLLAKF